MPEQMTVAGLLTYLLDKSVIGRPEQYLRDALAELGLYPETRLADIGAVYWPDDLIDE